MEDSGNFNFSSDFTGLEYLEKIKECLYDVNCKGSNVPDFDHSFKTLIFNQSELSSEQRALSDMPFPLSLDKKVYVAAICLAYAIIIFTSVLGNLLVCYVIIKMRRMHTVTNLFILNLAISDLLITCLNIPFSLVRLLMDDWPLGSVLCQLLPFVQVTAVYVSSWTMVIYSIMFQSGILGPLVSWPGKSSAQNFALFASVP